MIADASKSLSTSLKPYPKYKESGLPWLGQIPGHWFFERTKWRFRNRKELNTSGTHTNILSLTLRGVVNNDPDNPEGLVPKDYRTYQFFAKGDLVFKLIDLENLRTSRVGLVPEDGIMSSAYVRLAPSSPTNIRYFFHQFYDLYSRGIYNQLGAGVRSTLGSSDLLNVGIVIPPPPEQAAIVRFLDWANGRLERAIRAKRKVIALLNEQKQAIIHRAVTRGLDPNVALKPSGIPWLGEIPKHWELWRISRFARVGNGSTPSRGKPAYWNGGTYPWLNSSQVNRGFINSADQFVTQAALRECHLPRVPTGSVLVAITGQGKTRGLSAVLGVEATINQHIAFITPRVSIASCEFIHFVLSAAYLQLRASSEDSGSTKGAITCEDLKRFKMAIPPPSEQAALLKHVQAETRTLNSALSRLEREIELLREYRTRLVADVVTGKLDVREAAAGLPDEIVPDVAEVDTDVGDESEAVDDEVAV
jgi:type I restriction enzyme S subunit